jgi:hypothetical protein
MDRIEYVISGVEKTLLQSMPGCSSSDVVTCKITRLRDRYVWDPVAEEFTAVDKNGLMTFVSDILWQFKFTPDEAGDYVAYIKNVTLDTEYAIHCTSSSDPILIPDGSWGAELVVGTNTFCLGDAAETYYATRWGASKYWDTLTDTEKISAMVTAYNQIVKSGIYSLPETITNNMIMAQLEQALFLVIHGEDALGRGGLISQGVNQSSITKETYDPSMRGRTPICDAASELIKEYYSRGEGNYVVTIERDETEEA